MPDYDVIVVGAGNAALAAAVSARKNGASLEELVALLDLDNRKQALATLQAYNAAGRDAAEGFDPTKKDGMATRGLSPDKANWAIRRTSRRSPRTARRVASRSRSAG